MVLAQVTLQFEGPEALTEAVRRYSRGFGMGGLCLTVRNAYEVGGLIQLRIQVGGQALPLTGTVAWVRRHCIGVRFTPMSSSDQQSVLRIKKWVGDINITLMDSVPVSAVTPFTE
jgi:hypothetical protein